MQRRHHQVGSINQRLIKLKQGQKTAFPFPLMVSPLHSSSLNPYSLPFFIPLHFACRWRPNLFYLFVPFSIAMFSGLGFNPFFYLLFFGLFGGNFIRVSFFLCYRILRVTSNICFLYLQFSLSYAGRRRVFLCLLFL